jgi:hypothetical protein
MVHEIQTQTKKQKKKKKFLIFFFFCFCLWFMTPEGARGIRDSWPLRSSKPWMVHEIQTQTKKQKKKKKVFNFFFFFLFLFMIHDTWGCSRDQGLMTPWGPRNPEWFMNQTWIKKQKKKKKFLIFFLFLFLFMIHDTWGCSRDQGFITPEVLETLNGSWIRHE